jgi:hypothetical protein
MLETHIILRNKVLRADDPRIRKIARSVLESVASAEFKLPLALLFKNPLANYFSLPCLPRR